MRRVVVTGLGMVTPLGCGVEPTWTRILAGNSGAKKIDTFDASDLTCQIACMIPRGDGTDRALPGRHEETSSIPRCGFHRPGRRPRVGRREVRGGHVDRQQRIEDPAHPRHCGPRRCRHRRRHRMATRPPRREMSSCDDRRGETRDRRGPPSGHRRAYARGATRTPVQASSDISSFGG